jgi:hypothetical protein
VTGGECKDKARGRAGWGRGINRWSDKPCDVYQETMNATSRMRGSILVSRAWGFAVRVGWCRRKPQLNREVAGSPLPPRRRDLDGSTVRPVKGE